MWLPKWTAAVMVGGGLMVGLVGYSIGAVHVPAQHHREVFFTYRARLTQLPQQAETVDVWIPMAQTTREQQILHRQVHTSFPYTITQDPEYGNDILHLKLQPPLPDVLDVAIDYHARLGPREDGIADPSVPADDPTRHLSAQGLVIIDDEVRARAARAVTGRATPTAKARSIYEAVIQQVKYDKNVPGWGRGDTRRVCLLGAGNCTDFHSLFISMARASRIPARFKIGVVVPQEGSGTIPGYHCWAEFYEEGRGWVPVDASEAWKHPDLAGYYFGTHDPNRLLLSQGRDIRLVPPPHGGPVNIFFYPYVEVDGQVLESVETQLTFRELT